MSVAVVAAAEAVVLQAVMNSVMVFLISPKKDQVIPPFLLLPFHQALHHHRHLERSAYDVVIRDFEKAVVQTTATSPA